MADMILPSASDVAELRRIRDKVDGMRGAGVTNRRESITIERQQQPSFPTFDQDPVIFYGKIATGWLAGGTYVELTPCNSDTDPTSTGAPNGHARVFCDFTAPVAPAMFTAAVGDILAYVVIDASASPPIWLLVSPPVLTPGSANFQCLQMSSGVAVFDFPRAH